MSQIYDGIGDGECSAAPSLPSKLSSSSSSSQVPSSSSSDAPFPRVSAPSASSSSNTKVSSSSSSSSSSKVSSSRSSAVPSSQTRSRIAQRNPATPLPSVYVPVHPECHNSKKKKKRDDKQTADKNRANEAKVRNEAKVKRRKIPGAYACMFQTKPSLLPGAAVLHKKALHAINSYLGRIFCIFVS